MRRGRRREQFRQSRRQGRSSCRIVRSQQATGVYRDNNRAGQGQASNLAIIGDTGSGKAVHISSTIPVPPQASFPHGKMAKISDLHEGDLVYGRDGKPYPLLKLHPIHTEDLYESPSVTVKR